MPSTAPKDEKLSKEPLIRLVTHRKLRIDIVSLEINFGERFCLNVYIIVIITILIAVPQGSLLELKTIAIKMSFSPNIIFYVLRC